MILYSLTSIEQFSLSHGNSWGEEQKSLSLETSCVCPQILQSFFLTAKNAFKKKIQNFAISMG